MSISVFVSSAIATAITLPSAFFVLDEGGPTLTVMFKVSRDQIPEGSLQPVTPRTEAAA
jgi:hypothetical protein